MPNPNLPRTREDEEEQQASASQPAAASNTSSAPTTDTSTAPTATSMSTSPKDTRENWQRWQNRTIPNPNTSSVQSNPPALAPRETWEMQQNRTIQIANSQPQKASAPQSNQQKLEQNITMPSGKWYKGDTPTQSETLAQIYRISLSDPKRGEQEFNQYQAYLQDPSSPWYNPYDKATNTAINALSELGYDMSGGVTQDWLNANQGLQQYLQFNSAGNIQAPTKKSSKEQKAAYYYYQLLLAEGTTEQAETEWAALQEEITYWTGRQDLNLSDDEVLAKIDWSKYKTLTGMDDNRAKGKPTELNRSIGYNQDALSGVIWAARNGVTTDDGMNSIRAALGMGTTYERKDEIKNKLDPNSTEFAPYSVCTLDDAARYFGVESFDKGWLEANRAYAFSNDETAKKYFEQVYKAELTTETAEAELEALNAEIEKRLKYYPDDPDKILNKIDWDKDYPTLKKMNETMRGGSLLMTTRPIDFRKEDLEQSVREKCGQGGENESIWKKLLRAARPSLMESGTDTERDLLDSGYDESSTSNMTDLADGIDSGSIDTTNSATEAYDKADQMALDDYLDAYGVTQEYNTAKDNRDSAAKNLELLMQGIIPDELKEKYPQFFQNDAAPIPATEEPEAEEEEPTTSSVLDTYKTARDLPKGLTTAKVIMASDIDAGGGEGVRLRNALNRGENPGAENAPTPEDDIIQKLINMEQNQLDENQAKMDELEEKDKNALAILEEIYSGYDGADQIATLLGEDTNGRRQTLAELDYYFELGKDYVPTDRSDYSLYDYCLQKGADPAQVGTLAKTKKFSYQAELLQIDKVLKSLEEKGFNFNKEYFSTDGKYQFYNNIQRRKEYLQREIQAADYYQIRNSADFSEVVADGKEKITSAWGNAWNKDVDYFGIDSMHDGYSRLSWTAAAPEHGITFEGSGTGDTKMYALSQEERDTYIYIREKQGEDAAKAYYDYLTNDDYGIVTNRMAYNLQDAFTTPEGEDWGVGDWLAGAFRTAASIVASPLKIAAPIYAVSQKLQGKEINQNSAAFGVDIFTGAVRSDFKNQITNTFGEGSYGDFLGNLGFDVLTSAGDSMMNSLVFGGLGEGLAGKAKAAKEVGNKLAAFGFKAASSLVSSTGMGLGAAGSAIRDAKLRGATDDQALAMGGLTFICETITEAFTIDNMVESYGFGQAKDAKAFKKFMAHVGSKYLDEPLAEAINEILEDYGERAILEGLSSYNQRVSELTDSGMTTKDAEQMAQHEFWLDVGYAAATGELSGLVTSISAYGAGRNSARSEAQASLQRNQVRVDNLGNIITEETGNTDYGPATAPAAEETTTAETTQTTEETAATEETPATEETQTTEEAPTAEEAPATEEAPAAEEAAAEEATEEAATEEEIATEEASTEEAAEEATEETAAAKAEESPTSEFVADNEPNVSQEFSNREGISDNQNTAAAANDILAREAIVEERGNVQEPALPELATAVGNEMEDVFGSSEEFYAVRDATQAAADSLDALEKATTAEETAEATAEAEAAEADAARNSVAYVMSAMQQAYQSTKLALTDAMQGLVERGLSKVHQFALNKAYKNIESWSQLYDQAAAEYQKIVDQYNEIVHARETYEAIQNQYDQESRAGAIDDDGLSVYNDQLNEAAYKYKVLGGEEMEAQLKRGLSWTVADRQGYANEGAEAATQEYQSLQEGQAYADKKAAQYFASFKQNLKEAGQQLLDACKTGFKALRYAVNSLRTPAQQTKPSNPNNPIKVASQLTVLGSAQEADAGSRTAAIGAVLLPSGQRDLYSLGTASTAAQYLTNKYGPSALKTLRNLILDANETNRSTDEITSAISTAALSDNPEVQEKLDAVMTGTGTDFDLDSMISMTRNALKDPTSVELMRQKVRNNMIGRRTLDLIGRGALNSVAPYEQQVDHAKTALDNANSELEQAEETQEQMQNNLVDAQQSWLAELDNTLRNDKTIAALRSNVTTALNALQGQIKVAAEYAQRQQNAEAAYKEAEDQLDMKRDEALGPVREQAEAEVDAELNAEAEEAARIEAERVKSEQEAAEAAALDQAAKEKAETDFAEYQEAVTNLTPAAEAGRMIETTQKNGRKIKITGVAYMKDGGHKIYYTTSDGKIISSDMLADPNGVSSEVTGDFDDDAWDRAEGAEGPAVPLDTSITVEEVVPEGGKKKKRPKRKEVIGLMPTKKGGDTRVMFSDGTTGVWEDYNPVRNQDGKAFDAALEAHEDELDKAYKKQQKPGLRPKPYEAAETATTTETSAAGESSSATAGTAGVNTPEAIQTGPTKSKVPTDRTENTVPATAPTEMAITNEAPTADGGATVTSEVSGVNTPDEIQTVATKPETPTDRVENTVPATAPTAETDTSAAEAVPAEAPDVNTTPVQKQDTTSEISRTEGRSKGFEPGTTTTGKVNGSPQQIAKNLAKTLKVGNWIGTKNMNGMPKSVLGYYQNRANYLAVRSSEAGNYMTTMHEIGHAISKRLNMSGTQDMVSNLDPVFRQSYSKAELPGEAFAECMWRYMADENSARAFAGDAFIDNLENRMRQEGIWKDVQKAAKDLQAWIYANPSEQMGAVMHNRGEKQDVGLTERIRRAISNNVDASSAAGAINNEIRRKADNPKGKLSLSEDIRANSLLNNHASKRARYIVMQGMTDSHGTRTGEMGMAQALSGVKAKDSNLFERYLLAMHSLDRDAQGKKVFDDHITPEARKQFIQEMDESHKEFKQAAEQLHEFWKSFMQHYMVDTGFLSQETFDKFNEMYPNYVPTERVKSTETAGKGKGNGKTYQVREATGSTEDIWSPLDTMVSNINKIVAMVNQNNVGLAFDTAFQKYSLGEFGRDITADVRKESVDTKGLQQRIQNYIKSESDVFGSAIRQDIVEKILNMIGEEQVAWKSTGKSSEPNTITVQRPDGQKVFYQISDLPLFKLLAGINDTQVSAGWQAVGKATHAMSALTTGSNPVFAIRNFLRDFQNSVNYGSWASNYLTGALKWARAAMDVATGKGKYQDYVAMGGGGWTRIDADTEQGVKDYRTEMFKGGNTENVGKTAKFLGQKLWNTITFDRLNEIVEQTSRYAEYKYGKNETDTAEGRARAFLASQDDTVDFSRRGNGRFASELKQLIPFLGASMQGVYRTGRMFTTEERSRLPARLAKTVVNTALVSALCNALLFRKSDDDEKEEFLRMSDELKSQHFYLPNFNPDVFGQQPLIRIPLAQDPLTYAIHGMMTNAMWKGTGDGPAVELAAVANTVLDNLNPFGSGTIFQPIIGVLSNKNWYGSRIVPSRMEDWDASTQYTNETPDIFVEAGRATNISPLNLQYLAEQYTGFLGQMMIPALSKDKNTGEIGGAGAALNAARKKLTSDPLVSNDVLNSFYDGATTISQVTSAAKNDRPLNMLRRGLTADEAEAAYAEAKQMTGTGGIIADTKKTISEKYAEIDEINANETLTTEQKTSLIKEARREMIDAALLANEAIGAYNERYITGSNIVTNMLTAGSMLNVTKAENQMTWNKVESTFRADVNQDYMKKSKAVWEATGKDAALPHPDREMTIDKKKYTVEDKYWKDYQKEYKIAYMDYITENSDDWDMMTADEQLEILKKAHTAAYTTADNWYKDVVLGMPTKKKKK